MTNMNRRKAFMMMGGVGAAGLMVSKAQAAAKSTLHPLWPDLSSHLAPRPYPELLRPLPEGGMTGNRKFGYAIIGLGKYAINQILPAFAESQYCRVAALVSGDPKKAARIADTYGLDHKNIYNYDNFDAIKNNPEVDAVYIILPNSLHCEMTLRAFRAGKHVMCEKPMAVSVEECTKMIEASKKAGKYLTIGYRCHYDALTRHMVGMLDQGIIGKSRMISTQNNDVARPDDVAQQWRFTRKLAGGGSLMDLGIYGVNGARYLSNEDPISVSAYITPNPSKVFSQVEDTISWTMHYASGLVAQGGASFSTYTTSRFSLAGEKGTFSVDPATSYWNNHVNLSLSGDTHTWEQPMFTKSALDQFSSQLDALPLAIYNKVRSASTGEEGRRDVQIIMALYESAKNGGRMIDVSKGRNWAQDVYGKKGLYTALTRPLITKPA
ncbi:Gfo/Idh/MocA family oxidoreductase [Acetobacteraceae bacterium]|nr:Gfo/Idh/MocA family oxidoreductase [Acetobacteraceae bacterium]